MLFWKIKWSNKAAGSLSAHNNLFHYSNMAAVTIAHIFMIQYGSYFFVLPIQYGYRKVFA